MIDPELLNSTVRHTIKDLRTGNADTRMSQLEIGKILGLSRSAVANLETGKQKVSLHNVYALCDHLSLDLTDVLPSVKDMRVDKTDDTNKLPSKVELALSKMREDNQ